MDCSPRFAGPCCSDPPGSHPQQLLTVFRAEHSLLIDIPTGWAPRTEQLPGPQLSVETLVKSTAQLPQIDLAAGTPASILGKSTSACLQNGFVLGTASQLDGLAARFCAELSPQTAFYATGNLPRAIRDACRTPIRYRETLITDGLYRIWQKNRKG